MKIYKKSALILISFIMVFQAAAFDWPKTEVTKDSYTSYFGQNRGGILSTSVIFSEPSEIKAAESGYILAILTENEDDSDFFPSTLGTAVILAHEDNLLSVYGNIDKDTLTLNNETEKTIDAGAIIGQSGNSGYQNPRFKRI